jgi:hypothetical protein
MTSDGVPHAASALTIAIPPTQDRFSGSDVVRKMPLRCVSAIGNQQSDVRGPIPARDIASFASYRPPLPQSFTSETRRQIPTLRETSLDPLPVVCRVPGVKCLSIWPDVGQLLAARLSCVHLPAKKLARRGSRALTSLVTPMNACGLAEPTLERPDFGSTA